MTPLNTVILHRDERFNNVTSEDWSRRHTYVCFRGFELLTGDFGLLTERIYSVTVFPSYTDLMVLNFVFLRRVHEILLTFTDGVDSMEIVLRLRHLRSAHP